MFFILLEEPVARQGIFSSWWWQRAGGTAYAIWRESSTSVGQLSLMRWLGILCCDLTALWCQYAASMITAFTSTLLYYSLECESLCFPTSVEPLHSAWGTCFRRGSTPPCAGLARRRPSLALFLCFPESLARSGKILIYLSFCWLSQFSGRLSWFSEGNGGPGAAAAHVQRMPELCFAFSTAGRPNPLSEAPASRADCWGERGLAEVLRGTVGARPVRQGATETYSFCYFS